MSFQRSPFRTGVAACALLLPALAPAAAATAAASPLVFAPLQHTAGATPFFISHGGGTREANTTSTNWAGYATTGGNGAFTSVTTTFTQPAVTCTSGDQYSSFWVGLDGYSSNSVEQTGTEADCVGSTAEYSAWYEMYPKFPVTYSNTVKPGDVITESVAFSGTKTYTLTLTDTTEGWSQTTTVASNKGARSSAEVIAEAPYSGGVLPLADFGKVAFSGSTVNGATLSSANPIGIDMVSSGGAAEATTGSLSGGNFSITWNSY
jgi:hypothetical protein